MALVTQRIFIVLIFSISFKHSVAQGTTLPYQCDFEETVCNMAQSTEDTFNWQRKAGPTDTEGTGPGSAYNGEYYMYVETSQKNSNDYTIFQTPQIDYAGPACVSFYAHMHGESVGSLAIKISGSADTFRTFNGDQGNFWKQRKVRVDLIAERRVVFRATVGGPGNGDIAIDDLLITPGPCPLVECNFDEEDTKICDLDQQVDDGFDWTWSSSATPNNQTGPNQAQTPYGFIYINTANQQGGNSAKINTGALGAEGAICVEFWYYLYGSDLGADALTMYKRNANEGGTEVSEWSEGYNKGQQWIQFKNTVYAMSQDLSIGWKGKATGTRSQVAIDSVTILAGECPVYVELPYACSFEDGYCGITQRESDQFDWNRWSGKTDTADTGPASSSNGTYYLYTEADERFEGDRAYLDTPSIRHSGPACLKFYYHMEGADMGILIVFGSARGEEEPFFSKTGAQPNGWQQASIDINIQDVVVLSWIGRISTGPKGDMAIDNIEIVGTTCAAAEATTAAPETTVSESITTYEPQTTKSPPKTVAVPYVCDFEQSSMCDVTQMTDDDFDWYRRTGSTPTVGTGPTRAFSGNYYMYIEADGRSRGQEAILQTPLLSARGDICLSVYVHMVGDHVGSLSIYSTNNGPTKPFKTLAADTGRDWKEQKIDMNLRDREQVFFRAVTGSGNKGDIALDNFRFKPGRCAASGPSVSLPFDCDFEDSGACQMTLVPQDSWTRHSGPYQAIDGVGPDSAFTGRYYYHAESAGRNRGDMATLETPVLSIRGAVCVQFGLHMTGRDVGTFSLLTLVRGDMPWKTVTREQGSKWVDISQTVTLSAYDKVRFRATVGSGDVGVIAIDGIKIKQRSCPSTITPRVTTGTYPPATTTKSTTSVAQNTTNTRSFMPETTEAAPPVAADNTYIIVIGVLGAICGALLIVAIIALVYVKILKSRKVEDGTSPEDDYYRRHGRPIERSAAMVTASKPNGRADHTEMVPAKGEGLPTAASLSSLPSRGGRALPPLQGAAPVRSSDPFANKRIGDIS